MDDRTHNSASVEQWRTGWQAHLDGLDYDQDASEEWQAGWQTSAGWMDYQAGASLPVVDGRRAGGWRAAEAEEQDNLDSLPMYKAGKEDHQAGYPFVDWMNIGWRQGWMRSEMTGADPGIDRNEYWAGRQAQYAGAPDDTDASASWRKGWMDAVPALDDYPGWLQDRPASGTMARIMGAPFDPDASAQWQTDWRHTQGAQAYKQGLLYEEWHHPDWQAGYMREAGYTAYVATDAPYLDNTHPQWQYGWQLAAGRQAYLDGQDYDPTAHPGWQAGWQGASE